jgi:hypothetical protein
LSRARRAAAVANLAAYSGLADGARSALPDFVAGALVR